MRKFILLFLLTISITLGAQETTDSVSFYTQKFQFKEALKFIDSQEKTKNNQFQKAMCYKALGENKRAIAILEELSDEYPLDITIKTELAQCYERSSRWDDTAETYSKLMEIDTTNIYFSVKKSEAEINRKNYKQGISNLQTILEKDTLLSAVKVLGKSYEVTNNLDSAYYYYDLAWSADSLDAFSAANLVNVSLKKKEYLPALVLSDKFLRLDPQDKQMNALNGYAYYVLEDYMNACRQLQKCYNAGDSSHTVVRSLGMSYFYGGDKDNAYDYLSKAYKNDTTNVMVMYNLASSSLDLGKDKEAISLYESILQRLIPEKVQLYLNYKGLAKAYENVADYDNAAANYIKAIQNATEQQKMDVVYPLAQIWEEKLDNPYMALSYYRQYDRLYEIYVDHYKKTQPNTPETKELIKQQTVLKAHIKELNIKARQESEKRMEEDTGPAPKKPSDDFLFVVNGEVDTNFDPQNSLFKMQRQTVIADFEYEGLSEEELVLVERAKKENKTKVIILLGKKAESPDSEEKETN